VITVLFFGALAAASGCPDPQDMLLIRGGPFSMGSHAGERILAMRLSSPAVREAGWFRAELPRRHVVLPAFCIDRLLVSQARYARFVAATGHRAPGLSREQYIRQGFLVHDYDGEVRAYLWHGREPPARRADHPVVLVDAHDAEAYCRWRDPALRLPSEAEWEKAARGADGRIFPWGNAWDPARLNSAQRGPARTTPVADYPAGASPYGVLDAVGNVFQWTATSLPDGRRVLKGCAWDDEAGLCRPAFRHGRPPASRHILIGFRCAAPAEDRPAPEPSR
jgi:formylglycine-generating enzyme required for sulfatase activity